MRYTEIDGKYVKPVPPVVVFEPSPASYTPEQLKALELVNRRSKPRIRPVPRLNVYSCDGAGLHTLGMSIEGAYRAWQIAGGWR